MAPTPGPGDSQPTKEFAVDSSLRIDDLLYLITPFPVLNQSFASVTGILAFRNNNSKIEPRAAGDYVAGAAQLGSFAPTPSFIHVGDTGAPTIPEPLTVSLVAPAATDTVVTVTSSDESALTVVGGGVTVPAGQTSVPVLVNGLAQAADVTLTATLDSTSLDAHVRVVDEATESPAVVSVTPDPAQVTPGGTVTLTVSLDFPPNTDRAVDLAVAPGNAGSVPASVTVPADQTEATFDYTDANNSVDGVVTATLGASSATATVQVQTGPTHLVINEVDYNQTSTDTTEFVEIYNPTASDVDLTNLSVVLINGNGGAEYTRVDLGAAGYPAGGRYLVVADSGTTVDPGAIRIDFATATDSIQNGDPDGVALIDTSSMTVVDALSYGGEITAASITGFPGPVSLVEGTATADTDASSGDGSLSRIPDGSDTDDAATDWAFTLTPTPGTANVLTAPPLAGR